MFKLANVPQSIEMDYTTACDMPQVVLEKASFLMAERVWGKALILAIAYAQGTTGIPMAPSKSLHYFQRARELAGQLEAVTRNIAVRTIDDVFGQVMEDNSLRTHFCAAIIDDCQLRPEVAQRFGVVAKSSLEAA